MGDNMYDLNSINDYLNTESIGRTVVQYDELNSTYAKAKNIFNTCPEGAVVLSESQLKWNLRMGKQWICYPGKNIYLSIILKTKVNNHLISMFDVIGCVSVCEAINTLYRIECKIKWPNDIIINDRKISSICSSIFFKNNKTEGAIISLGINANIDNTELELNDEIKDVATSLFLEISEEVDREALIGEILNNIEKYYNELIINNTISKAVSFYNQNLVNINKDIEIMKKSKKSKRKVHATSIDPEGWLIVTNEKGNEEILDPGEIMITYEKQA